MFKFKIRLGLLKALTLKSLICVSSVRPATLLIMVLLMMYSLFAISATKVEKNKSKNELHKELKDLKALFLTDKGKHKIKTSSCHISNEKWATFMLTQTPFTEKVKFNKNCDLEGEFTPKLTKDFPLNFKVKSHKSIKSIKALANIKIGFKEKAIITLQLKELELVGTQYKNIFYTHRIELSLLSNPPQKKSLGGELKYKNHSFKVPPSP